MYKFERKEHIKDYSNKELYEALCNCEILTSVQLSCVNSEILRRMIKPEFLEES